jgi:hypothetical protein
MIKSSAAFLFLVLVTNLIQAQDFQPGRYYDRKGKRVDGYILNPPLYHKAPPEILFKKNLSDPKPEIVKVGNMKGLVIGADTFAILHEFRAEGTIAMYINVVAGIARVVEVGKVTLYEYKFIEKISASPDLLQALVNPIADFITRQDYATTNYLLQASGKNDIFAARMDQLEFNRQMSDYLKMNQPLSDSLRAGAYSNKNTPEVIHAFNTWYTQRKAAEGSAKP